MIKIFVMVTFLLSGYLANAEECQHRIIFLPQTHQIDTEITGTASNPYQNEAVASSQFQIAKYIDSNKSLPVFSEEAAKDYNWQDFPASTKNRATNIMKTVFPDGLPASFVELNELQKKKLVDNGADFIELARQKITTIHKVVESQDVQDATFAPIQKWFASHPNAPEYPPEIKSLIYDKREKMALQQINSFFSKNPGQKDIVLIYGANHNFSIYPELFPPACVLVPYQFQKQWNGAVRGEIGSQSSRNNYGQSAYSDGLK